MVATSFEDLANKLGISRRSSRPVMLTVERSIPFRLLGDELDA
jgi:hypothetical protein